MSSLQDKADAIKAGKKKLTDFPAQARDTLTQMMKDGPVTTPHNRMMARAGPLRSRMRKVHS